MTTQHLQAFSSLTIDYFHRMVSTATNKVYISIYQFAKIIYKSITCAYVYVCVCVDREKESNCVDASVFPSGLKAAAIVDLGGGCRGQYVADICNNDPASTLESK